MQNRHTAFIDTHTHTFLHKLCTYIMCVGTRFWQTRWEKKIFPLMNKACHGLRLPVTRRRLFGCFLCTSQQAPISLIYFIRLWSHSADCCDVITWRRPLLLQCQERSGLLQGMTSSGSEALKVCWLAHLRDVMTQCSNGWAACRCPSLPVRYLTVVALCWCRVKPAASALWPCGEHNKCETYSSEYIFYIYNSEYIFCPWRLQCDILDVCGVLCKPIVLVEVQSEAEEPQTLICARHQQHQELLDAALKGSRSEGHFRRRRFCHDKLLLQEA